MNYSESYRHGTQVLSAAGISEAALDARLLLEFLTGCEPGWLYAHPDAEIDGDMQERYERLLERRAARIPLQHITGTCSFMGIDFCVSDAVLIPRQDSECLVEEAMRYVSDGSDILDICTGSGCLLLSLMHYKNGCRGVGTDISEDALAIAKKNLEMLERDGGLNGGSVRFLHGDLYDALAGADEKFDYIISNPPYIRSKDIADLMPEVRDHEPHTALDGGADGLGFYKRIAEDAAKFLRRGGMAFFEIGFDQADEVVHILELAGFKDISVVRDYGGNDRVVKGYRHV